MLGHLIAAAGAVELIICVDGDAPRRAAADDQLRDARPGMRPGLRSERGPRDSASDHVLSNSFGFGGQNISLIVSRFVE